MKYIIIDTSSILFGLKYKKNVFEVIKTKYISNYKIFISKGIINELARLSKSKSKLAVIAKMALLLIYKIRQNERKVFIYKRSNINVDTWILNISNDLKNIDIITNDTNLAKKIHKKNKK
ncbi:MAG: hypothetical protein QXP35_01940, partial [Candidatus Micrarchaeaceae archaeon]